MRPKTKCIFCDSASGARLTKEHVFPDWLRQLFPRSPNDSHTRGQASWAGLEPTTAVTKGQGQAGSRRVKVVCKDCNNGWLSNMENQIKPLLMRLIRGEPCVLDTHAQRTLAAWAAKTAMVGEFVQPTKVAIPPADRQSFMRNQVPPESGWWIWIAGNGSIEWLTGINHFSARLNVTPVAPVTPNIVNLQSTTLGIGQLLIHLVSTTVAGQSFALKDPEAADLRPIWPPPNSDIIWPRLRLLTDDDINFIAGTIPAAFGVKTPNYLAGYGK